MNKMAKGALAIGAGAALLLGGGGTLAVWNETADADAGTIAAGNLSLDAETGSWASNVAGPIADISDYKVVPGELLTYTQVMDVTLDGTNLSAQLLPTGVTSDTFVDGTVNVSDVVLTKDDVTVVNPLSTSVADIEASITFDFLAATTGTASTNATYDFTNIGFELEQIAPDLISTPAPTTAS